LHQQISAVCTTIGEIATDRVICGACSVSDFGGIDHSIQHKTKFDPGPTKRHLNNREFLMTAACSFMAAGRFGVGGFVLRKHDVAQSLLQHENARSCNRYSK
jgi:hypothetical protein